MNKFLGIPRLAVKEFDIDCTRTELNRFLENHDGDIVDIQYSTAKSNGSTLKSVLVVYQKRD